MRDFHPLANLFPLIEGEAFDDLVADIKANGLRDPIDVMDDLILDGRNRARACHEAGVEPNYVPFMGSDADALAFVISKNLKRRHLNESQRAMVAAKLANLSHGQKTSDASIEASVSQPSAARTLNVSRPSVQRAKVVQEKGSPELRHAVEQGQVSVTAAAEIAELPQKEQRDLVAKGSKEVSAKAKQLRAKKAKRRRPKTAKTAEPESQHDFDLRVLRSAWESACQSARKEFLLGLGYNTRDAA